MSENQHITSLKTWSESILVAGITVFSFTLGYLHSARIPEVPSVTESGYFFVSIFFGFSSQEFWIFFTSSYPAIVVAIMFILRWIFSELKPYVQKPPFQNLLQLKHIRFSALAWPVILSTALYISLQKLKMSPESHFVQLFGTDLYPIKRSAYFVSTFFLVLLGPCLILVQDKAKSFWKLLLLAATFLGIPLLAYQVSYQFSGQILQFPLVRTSQTSADVMPLLWKSGSTLYLLECSPAGEWSTIGYDSEKEFYVATSDRNLLSAACPSIR